MDLVKWVRPARSPNLSILVFSYNTTFVLAKTRTEWAQIVFLVTIFPFGKKVFLSGSVQKCKFYWLRVIVDVVFMFLFGSSLRSDG